jgi:esterase/lipase superfamily enzyme
MGPPRVSGSLKSLLAAQLGMCIAAMKAGKQDQVLRMSSFVSALFIFSRPSCFLFSTALSGGHDVWNVVFDMVKNVSDVMMSTLPNFWKIAKGFLDGKYRKVRFHCFLKVRSTDYPAVAT